MTTDPRAALDRLVDALQVHLAASAVRRGSSDPAVVAAYDTLADAFETYDEALFDAYGETTPFELYDEDEDDDELDDETDPDDLEDDDDTDEDDFDDHVDDELEERMSPS
ncbi:hypothetical protein GCM10028777_19990 [Angustibacter speluncae]